MPKYRLLAIDIDGTLVNSRDELTRPTLTALRRAREAGVRIVLATGRRYGRALPLVAPLELDAPLVCNCGALIKRPLDHQTLFEATLDRDLLGAVLAHVDRAGYDPILYADTHAEEFDFYCRHRRPKSPELAEFLDLNDGYERVSPSLVADPPPGIFALCAMGTRDEMLLLERQLQAALPERLYTHVLRSPRYRGYMCEIAGIGITKWSGIERLAREWGIADAEICAVGDDVNDLPMIRAAGLGVAMGNALDEVKAAADRVAPRHDDDGLLAVVEWLGI
ncbi:MAG: HAD family phosphatase [Pirellulales bacterium]|nr:HAD family phosphatase [Pirellulales bacterium]